MSHELDPRVGRWYRCIDDEELFKVVSIDEDEDRIEIRYADGDLEELDSAGWVEMDLERAEEPDDWRDPDEEDEAEDAATVLPDDADDEGRPRRPAPKRPREDWDEDDEEEDDWDEDEDDDSYDSDR